MPTTMPIFSVDVRVAATAYIRAATPEAAMEIAKGLEGTMIDVSGDSMISDLKLNDKDLPNVSLSPMMTIQTPFDDEPVLCVVNGDQAA